ERNQVRQRIEFAPERAFRTAPARRAPVEQIENAREQNEREREFDLTVVGIAQGIGFDNFGQRHKTAEQIARRQQIRQKINFQPAFVRIVRRRCCLWNGLAHLILNWMTRHLAVTFSLTPRLQPGALMRRKSTAVSTAVHDSKPLKRLFFYRPQSTPR